jgi:hypothetical protein
MDIMQSILDLFYFTSRAKIIGGSMPPFGPAKRNGPGNGVKR